MFKRKKINKMYVQTLYNRKVRKGRQAMKIGSNRYFNRHCELSPHPVLRFCTQEKRLGHGSCTWHMAEPGRSQAMQEVFGGDGDTPVEGVQAEVTMERPMGNTVPELSNWSKSESATRKALRTALEVRLQSTYTHSNELRDTEVLEVNVMLPPSHVSRRERDAGRAGKMSQGTHRTSKGRKHRGRENKRSAAQTGS